MNLESQIIDVLKNCLPKLSRINTYKLEQIETHSYRFYNKNNSFFIKCFPKKDILGSNEIQINKTLLVKANIPVPSFVFDSKTTEAIIACWKWVDGSDIRTQNRHLLPDAFTMLGQFHLEQRYKGNVCSSLTHKSYASIRKMLKAEVDFLCPLYDNAIKLKCASIFSLLEEGCPTIIHGDMHPGNILLDRKSLFFTDWGYSINSINLLDLDYIQSIPFGSGVTDWWIIDSLEAKTVLPAYFKACGLEHLDVKQTHRAVMLRNELIINYKSMKNNDQQSISICHQNIDLLLLKS
ncbi:MAG: phosphotransferase [bacterium]|nr:phosphotransferase [bacterium]